jgi:hypothetical protein
MATPLLSRRQLLQSAAAAGAALPLAALARADDSNAKRNRFVGVQIHPFSFYDEGPEQVLDLLQETAGINALLVYTHLYGADPAMPKDVLASDHPGFEPPDPKTRRYRRVWAQHTDQAFAGQRLRHPRTETNVEFAGKDIFADLAKLCDKRGMQLMGRILEPRGPMYATIIENWNDALTVDLDGKRGENACWNNPDYRSFWEATVGDVFRNNPLAGFMLGAERTGPLYRLINSGEAPSCFCEHCQVRMKERGVDETRLREGYTALNAWVQSMRRQTKRPVDGALITFLRYVMRYPEVLVWEREWALSLEEALAALVKKIKSVKPEAIVGRHIDHQQTTWDIFYRAALSYAELAASFDFLKPVVYHDIAAPRVERWFVNEFNKSLLADFSKQQTLDFYYAVFGLDPTKEPALEQLRSGGFSPDYVYRETRRCVEGVAGKAPVYPGIGFDIPFHRADGPPAPHPSQPEILTEATRQAFLAGADGIVVCREYQEMRVPNLKAIGRAIAEVNRS